MKTITLYPVAMRMAYHLCIYQPSNYCEPKTMDVDYFVTHYSAVIGQVCFDEVETTDELRKKAQEVLMWGYGMDCWYVLRIATTEEAEAIAEVEARILDGSHKGVAVRVSISEVLK